MNTRYHFFKLLTQPLPTGEFREYVTHLLARDPLFVPGYIEHIRYAEQTRDLCMYVELLVHTRRVISRTILDSAAQQYIIENWSDYEINAFHELLRQQRKFEKNPFRKALTYMYTFIFTRVVQLKIKTRSIEESGTYLYIEKTYNPKPFQKEVKNLEPYWWNMNKVRAQTISYHRHTSVILLRSLVENKEEYIQRDGVHESEETIHVKRFPQIHKAVTSFAKEKNLGLGRVALVRLDPYTCAYRHFDDEIYTYLKGRKRYHFVVQAEEGSILSAGTDTAHPKPGEVWYINNGVMHYAHNNSSVPRIHAVFDGYPLENIEEK